jgi:hypothetical protein
MTLINNDRDMRKLLDDLRVGEFSARDLQAIALTLPVSVLAAALYANAGGETFKRAGTHDQKADVVARLLHAWCMSPELRLGQLVSNLSSNIANGSTRGIDPYYIEDGELAERADAQVTRRAELKPPA